MIEGFNPWRGEQLGLEGKVMYRSGQWAAILPVGRRKEKQVQEMR